MHTSAIPRDATRDAQLTLADGLVEALVASEIDTFFGVPGGAIEPLFNALARARERGIVTVIATRSESGAGFAADGYYRATGKLAVCTATTGPGITNLITAVATAHADRIPMLVLTPQVSLAKHGRGALQDSSDDGYDMVRILKACTVSSTVVTHPEQLPHKLLRALRRATQAPMGPVHLALPSDLLAAATHFDASRFGSTMELHPRGLPLNGLREVCTALEAAQRPIFYVGDDAGVAAKDLCAMASAVAGKVIASPAGKRWVEHVDPHFVGVLGFSGHAQALTALRKADLVVSFGATFDELSTNAWSALPTAVTYCIDSHAEFAYRLPHAHVLVADIAEAIRWLSAHLPNPMPRARLHAAVASAEPSGERTISSSPSCGVHPGELMQWLSQELPESVVVHVDSGNSFSWSTRDLIRSKADTYRVAMGFSTMAWAIGAVLGAAVGSGERTICITGDGAMLMSSLELSTAVQEQLPVTYIVLNDAGLGMVRHGQRLARAPSIAHEIPEVRFDLLANACGAPGMRVHSTDDLARIPREYLSSPSHGPFVVDVLIDREAVPPMADRVRGLAEGVPK